MNNFSDIIKNEKLTLVDFYTEWCAPCKAMIPILEELKSSAEDKVTVLKIDAEKNQQISTMYQIRNVPTFFLFKNGNVLWKHSGHISLNNLKEIINQFQ